MNSGPEDRLLRLAEELADGRTIDWDEVVRREPDLAPALERFRQLQAIATAHEAGVREQGEGSIEVSSGPPQVPLFSWGEIQILQKLGEGGFAEVYRAWDPSLRRQVALKLSRSDTQLAATGVQRWLDEARRLARVRHPNIPVVHGVDVRDGRAGFWTDLVLGRTLEQALQEQGAFGAAEAALVGLDLCRALAAVHAAGLAHGDVKTSNVMREGHREGLSTSGAGRIVLTDFGASGESTPSVARTASFVTPLTSAPEVMRGEPPSPASDLYSLGVLLYRLLTGRHPIESSDLAELESMIQLGRRTPLRDLRPELGSALVAVVERALELEPGRRFASAGEMERALSQALVEEPQPAGKAFLPAQAIPIPRSRGRGSRGQLWIAVILVVLSGMTWWTVSRNRTRPVGPMHFTVHGPPNRLVHTAPNEFAISPDGSTLAFIAFDSTGQSLWVRRLGNFAPRELPGTNGAQYPFWSPDGKHIGFFAGQALKRTPAHGGDQPELICESRGVPHGASWGRKGSIVFASGNGPLFRVPESGGVPQAVTMVDTTEGINAHAWPDFLPDGEHFTYVARRMETFLLEDPPAQGPWTSYVGSIRSKRSEPLLEAYSAAMYAAPGHLVYVRDGVLQAQAFDARRRRLTGKPRRIANSPAAAVCMGSRCGSASVNGVLAWNGAGTPKSRLVWIDRSARRMRDVGIPSDQWVRLWISPDGRRAILRKEEQGGSNLWLLDLERDVVSRLTTGSEVKDPGAWSPDSREIMYSRRGRGGVSEIHRLAVDDPGSDRVFYRSAGHMQNAFGWSPDGKWVLIQEHREGTGFDLLVMSAQGGSPKPYLASPYNERHGEISPDGKWVVYLADESGAPHAYVQSFPTPGRKQQVSTVPLFYVSWGSHGREILLFAGDFRLRSVAVEAGDVLRLGPPRELFSLPTDTRWLAPAPDGERFLALQPDERLMPEPTIGVMVNWMAGLER